MNDTYLIAICGSCGKKISFDPKYYGHDDWMHYETGDNWCAPKTMAIPADGTEKELKRESRPINK